MAKTKRRKTNGDRPYQFIVVLDQEDRADLELVVADTKLTRADIVRQMIRARARGVRQRQQVAATG
jgi:hypothetical protein